MEEAGNGREEYDKEHRSQDTALLHPNVYLERLRLELSREHSGLHPIMQLLQDAEKLGWYPKFGEVFPEQVRLMVSKALLRSIKAT